MKLKDLLQNVEAITFLSGYTIKRNSFGKYEIITPQGVKFTTANKQGYDVLSLAILRVKKLETQSFTCSELV